MTCINHEFFKHMKFKIRVK